MRYEEWLSDVPEEITRDVLWKIEVYRIALFMADIAWQDVSKLAQDKRTVKVSNQLYRAVGSIGANIAEGYSRQSGKDQARLYEYALSSAREARHWYHLGRSILTELVLIHRVQLLTQIIRLLLTMIPNERGYKIKEDPDPYDIDNPDIILSNVPLP
jgi:four helix bundle protein